MGSTERPRPQVGKRTSPGLVATAVVHPQGDRVGADALRATDVLRPLIASATSAAGRPWQFCHEKHEPDVGSVVGDQFGASVDPGANVAASEAAMRTKATCSTVDAASGVSAPTAMRQPRCARRERVEVKHDQENLAKRIPGKPGPRRRPGSSSPRGAWGNFPEVLQDSRHVGRALIRAQALARMVSKRRQETYESPQSTPVPAAQPHASGPSPTAKWAMSAEPRVMAKPA